MNLTFWKKKSVLEVLNQHLKLMTDDEKVEHLKAIIPLICPRAHVSLNPTRAKKAERIEA